jgi:hypothetical protein
VSWGRLRAVAGIIVWVHGMSQVEEAHVGSAALVSSTRTARIMVRSNGCVVARIIEGARQTLADARANLTECIAACGGIKRPLLIDVTVSEPLEAEVRHSYSSDELVRSFLALALLVRPGPVGRLMGNIFLRVARPELPTRLFTEEELALAWLSRFPS